MLEQSEGKQHKKTGCKLPELQKRKLTMQARQPHNGEIPTSLGQRQDRPIY